MRKRPNPPPIDKDALKDVLVICTADCHFSLTPPIARSAESNWIGVMDRTLKQLRDLQKLHDCPVIIAGDLFDKWNPPIELLNFLISALPDNCYAIMGNHDAPNYRVGDLKKTAFCNLMKAGKLTCLHPIPREVSVKGTVLRLHGFSCGEAIKPNNENGSGALCLDIAVIHAYVWIKNCGFDGADEEDRLRNWYPKLKGYDAAIFGDNHHGFLIEKEGCPNILNCGCLIRRKSNERELKPSVGLLFRDGSIKRHYLDCLEDKWLDNEETAKLVTKEATNEELAGFVKELAELGDAGIDIREMIKQALNRFGDERVREFVLKSMEKRK